MEKLFSLYEDLDFEINKNGEFTDTYYSLQEKIWELEHILGKDD